MIKIFFAILCLTQAGHTENLVRVRLDSQIKEITIAGAGLQIKGSNDKAQLVSIPQDQKFLISRILVNGKTMWQVQNLKASKNAHNKIKLIGEKYLFISAQSQIASEGRTFPNKIFLYENKSHLLDLVGIMDMEDYLIGVVGSEMPPHWPIEALKAQAVAARSYALAKVHESPHAIWNLESSTIDQVFKIHHLNDHDQNAVEEAVAETKDLYLIDKKDRVYKAFYHSDCGGYTSTSHDVWGNGRQDKTAVRDPYCEINAKSGWNYSVPKKELTETLDKFFGFPGAHILAITKAKFHERVFDFQVSFDNHVTKDILGHDLRKILGFTKVKSTRVEIIDHPDSYEFVGRGYGHGVGLCQSGSRFLAMQGKSYSDILSHYYPDIKVLKTSDNSESEKQHSAQN